MTMAETRGKSPGRPKGCFSSKLDSHRAEIEHLLNNGATAVHIAKKFGYTWNGLHVWMKKNDIKRVTEGA
jgi:hypothetical protein